jgi:hypothetical protein
MTHSASLLFYTRPVALDRAQHAALKLEPATDLGFAAGASVVPLLGVEFTEAAREYPIVFLRNGEAGLVPVVLTGAPGGHNVYVEKSGRWNARYVPAYVRRYPFVFAQTAPDQFTVCIDAACPGLDESHGAPLFDPSGKPSAVLQQVVSGLSEFQRQAQLTETFMQRLEAAGLLMEAAGRVNLIGRNLALQGFWVVDETRLRALPPDTLQSLLTSGELGLIYAHLLSLGNLTELLRRAPDAAAAAA